MLPGYIAGKYTHDVCYIDLKQLCTFAKIELITEEVVNIDILNKLVYLLSAANVLPVSYDVLSINIGSRPKAILAITTCQQVIPVKPIDAFSIKWNQLLNKIIDRNDESIYTLAVVGGGAGGCELTFAVQYRIRQELLKHGRNPDSVKIVLLTRSSTLLPSHNRYILALNKFAFIVYDSYMHVCYYSEAGVIAARIMTQKGIQVIYNTDVVKAETQSDDTCLLYTLDGGSVHVNSVLWCVEVSLSIVCIYLR